MSNADSSDDHSSDENPAEEIEDDTEEQQRSEIRGKLTTMTFEELLNLKDTMGSKLYNKMLSGEQKIRKPFKVKRANKNRPQEISSKIRPRLIERTVAPKTKKKIVQYRDPRFDTLCGTFDKEKFQSDYKFIYDIQEKEQKVLEQEEKQEHDIERKKKLKSAIQRLKNKSKEKTKITENHQKRIENKLEVKEKLKRGEAPIRKKPSDEKTENLISQYDELKKSNKLDKYLIKKSKKQSIKEKKKNKFPG